MTRLHPEERPSKEQVARDLAAWQQLASEPVALDVSEARARLAEKLGPQSKSKTRRRKGRNKRSPPCASSRS